MVYLVSYVFNNKHFSEKLSEKDFIDLRSERYATILSVVQIDENNRKEVIYNA